jgi:lipoprotein NlpD
VKLVTDSGIVGYGELLIVKHNTIYLSAYGHNNRLLVAEGDTVRAGQKIAEKGSSGTDTVKLHFEIRKEGKPIDPKRLLPAKQ